MHPPHDANRRTWRSRHAALRVYHSPRVVTDVAPCTEAILVSTLWADLIRVEVKRANLGYEVLERHQATLDGDLIICRIQRLDRTLYLTHLLEVFDIYTATISASS